ncbi:MAG TPA: DUF6364 family protein [Prolixibacteraceae bacterium]|nr:DUF6364 family protein [Prolixibacteraceae bacterium]
MNTKLTLTLEKQVIQRAKKYARENGRSLSGIIENYLKMITKEEDNQTGDITPLVKSLKGSFKAPSDFDYKKELTNSLSDKYL